MFFEKTPILNYAEFLEYSFVSHGMVLVEARPFFSVSIRKRGRASFIIDGKKYVSDAGTLTFMPAGTSYYTAVEEPGEGVLMRFNAQVSEAIPFFTASIPIPEKITNIFDEAIKTRTIGKELFALSYAYRILAEIERALVPEDKRPPLRMRRAKTYLDANITDPSLRISSAADVAEVSDVYFRSEFRRYYGLSPIEYVKACRIELAKKLLSTGFCSVTEAALSCGFDSISYFSSEFKNAVGLSPSRYSDFVREVKA